MVLPDLRLPEPDHRDQVVGGVEHRIEHRVVFGVDPLGPHRTEVRAAGDQQTKDPADRAQRPVSVTDQQIEQVRR